MRCLVVVDMQPGFYTSSPSWMRRRVARLVRKFRKAKLPIVVLEYVTARYGETHKEIMRGTSRYNLIKVMEKDTDNGGRKVRTAVDRLKVNVTEFVVCGVNANACVKATVESLARSKPVRIIRRACNSGGAPFNWLRRRHNISIKGNKPARTDKQIQLHLFVSPKQIQRQLFK